MVSVRQAVFRRPKTKAAFKFTARDGQIIAAVAELRFATTAHVHKLCFDGKPSAKSWCKVRLQLLYHHGYLARIPKPTLGRPLAVYCLDKLGRDFLATMHDSPKTSLLWDKYDHGRSALFLDHALALNDVRINIAAAATNNGHNLTQWLPERVLKQRLGRDVIKDLKGEGKLKLVPDGWGQILLANGKRFSFCVELDRGTQWSEQYKRKVRAYLALWESGLYEKHYNTRSLTVLTVVTTGDAAHDNQRVQQLLDITNSQKDVARANTFEDLFYITTLETATPEAILTQPIWYVAGKEGTHGLIE